MSEFTLDTSGTVHFPAIIERTGDHDTISLDYRWSDLSPFERGYVEALLTSCDFAVRNAAGKPLTNGDLLPDWTSARFSDLAPATLAAILKDCAAWAEVVRSLAMGQWALRREDGASLWAIRNGQDAFMDQGIRHAEAMRKAFKPRRFPPQVLSLHDDGKVYLREGVMDRVTISGAFFGLGIIASFTGLAILAARIVPLLWRISPYLTGAAFCAVGIAALFASSYLWRTRVTPGDRP